MKCMRCGAEMNNTTEVSQEVIDEVCEVAEIWNKEK